MTRHRLTVSWLRRLFKADKFLFLNELNCERVEKALTTFSDEENLGHRTYNHYVQALKSFCRWAQVEN